jgi:hypothetical protein
VIRGSRHIHGLSYAERPGIALSIRTRERFGGLTCDYWSPGVCIETGFLDAPLKRRIKCLNALYAIDPALCGQALESAVSQSDVRSCFFLLRHAMATFREGVDLSSIGAVAAQSLGGHANTITMALREIERDVALRKKRKEVRDLEQRFLLSAIHLAPDRDAVKRLVTERYPDRDPEEFIVRCVLAMSSAAARHAWPPPAAAQAGGEALTQALTPELARQPFLRPLFTLRR